MTPTASPTAPEAPKAPKATKPTKGTGTPGRTPAPHLLRWLYRLHRPAFVLWTGLVALLALALLALWGPLTDAAAEGWRQYDACRQDGRCRYDQDAILRYKDVYTYTTFALNALPFLVAAWSGAALVGRELEHGTARLAWTQGISPIRWLTAKLAVPAVLLTAGTSLLVALHHLAWRAGQGRIDTAKSWYDDPTLHANGPTTVAFVLVGLAAGALAGLVLRRTLPALVLALGLAAAVRFLAGLAMPHLWPGVTRVTSLATGYVHSGIHVESGLVTSTGAHISDPGCGPLSVEACDARYAELDATGFYATYHPPSHYWPLQLTTTALVLTIATALALTAFLLLRNA
ncbi:ABC transporter permease subunit, partial [Streptomyces sp. A012304]|uniref:ABC transporter permease subunit n=1 Tax=Streptomyces sp. A012304 TaxID=375446 RepID=UPI002231F45B